MSKRSPRVLIAADEPAAADRLRDSLESTNYRLVSAGEHQEARDKLHGISTAYDALVVDFSEPSGEWWDLLMRLQGQAQAEPPVVIVQIASAEHWKLFDGINVHCLSKPVEPEKVLKVLDAALEQRQSARNAGVTHCGLQRESLFYFRDLLAAYHLASLLSEACPNSERVLIGLNELLINAIEHGNLGIGYQEKGELKEANRWEEEVQTRLASPQYRDRYVEVAFRRTQQAIEITITDQGEGFDWERYLNFDPARILDVHGRGVAISRITSFDRLEYRGKGNQVWVQVLLDSPVQPS